jgi:DNA-binding response OmpR family regulator
MLEPLTVDDIELIPSDQAVVLNDRKPIHLTNLELRLLHYLMGRPGRTLSIKELCLHLWRHHSIGDSSTLKNLVYRLRRKIEPDPAHPQYVRTVFGVGYRFMAI